MVKKQVVPERLPIMTYWLRKEGCNNLYLKSEWPWKGTKTPSIRDTGKLQKEKKWTFVLVTRLHIMRLKHHADMRLVRYKSLGAVPYMISHKKKKTENLYISYRGYFLYKTFISLPSYYALSYDTVSEYVACKSQVSICPTHTMKFSLESTYPWKLLTFLLPKLGKDAYNTEHQHSSRKTKTVSIVRK